MKRFAAIVFSILFLRLAILAQAGTYYNGIDTASSTFVTDLHNLINPHTIISYNLFDETNVALFASRDTTDGNRVVTCVYSGENYVYTPPFAWGYFSREHTWCQSWMPTVDVSGFESRPEYSDQHHLFPVNQNNANDPRSNHPLGEVSTVTYTYLQCKKGTDADGNTVFEPRDSHKGDAARALFYMAVCYNGVGGYDWTFNNLNNNILPALHEAPEDVDLLKQWSDSDPPDAWEIARNNFVDSLQGNRNPFVDHPEWVDLIDFNTLTKLDQSYATEPTNYVTSFSTTTITDTSIQLSWTDATAGSQAPSGYLLVANSSNFFTSPTDGTIYTDDTNLGDGTAVVNIANPSSGSHTFSGLHSGTTYYFRMYSYNGTGAQRNYKTGGTTPTVSGTTTGTDASGPSVVVNEYMNGSNDSTEWVELLVLRDNLDMRGMQLMDYSSSGNPQPALTFLNNALWSSVAKGSFIVVLSHTSQQAEDVDFSDKKVIIKASNSTYFTGGYFSIAGTADALEILSSSGVHIHALSHGSKPGAIDSIPSPKANASGNSSSGTVVGLYNVSSIDDYDSDSHALHSTTPTEGAPNDTQEESFLNGLLPVELNSFHAVLHGNIVELLWSSATEVDNEGFEVERETMSAFTSQVSSRQIGDQKQETWTDIAFITGAGTTNSPKEYSFTDKTIEGGRFLYRLRQVNRNGTFAYSPELQVTVAQSISDFSLVQNYPNPFNPSTWIRFAVPSPQNVSLKVYNELGQEVATLFDGIAQANVPYSLKFDASRLASGTYFYRLVKADRTEIKKMLLMK